MKLLAHGAILSEEPAVITVTLMSLADGDLLPCPQPTSFDYLFPTLQSSTSNRLPENATTARSLIDLGNSMSEPEPPFLQPDDPRFDSTIPSVYGYFGQFITHEIVQDTGLKTTELGPATLPLPAGRVSALKNARSPLLDLDSVYGPILDAQGKCYRVPQNGQEMLVARAGFSDIDGTDLPREPDPPFTARIGDRRNDANFITSQMHLAFLRAHNALVKHRSFEQAQRVLRQHFQFLIVSDFLPRIVDDTVLKAVLKGDFFDPPDDPPFMPVEFSAAAFRFGHSMPRHRYAYNLSHKNELLLSLFMPTPGNYHHILKEWIIDWHQFLPGGTNLARRIDTRLEDPLSHLIDENGKPLVLRLAAADLLRGYRLGLPTGQAVAGALKLPVMTATEIEAVARSPEQKTILDQSGLSSHTPLWYYILAEAAHFKEGLCLGPVGSTIVARVLVGLVRRSKDSILLQPNWTPELGTDGKFDLANLFQLAGV